MLHGLLVGNISDSPALRIFQEHLTSSPATFQNRSALRIHEISNSRLTTIRYLRPDGNTGDRGEYAMETHTPKKSRRGPIAQRRTKTPRVTRRALPITTMRALRLFLFQRKR